MCSHCARVGTAVCAGCGISRSIMVDRDRMPRLIKSGQMPLSA
jgi:hypothetical protein